MVTNLQWEPSLLVSIFSGVQSFPSSMGSSEEVRFLFFYLYIVYYYYYYYYFYYFEG